MPKKRVKKEDWPHLNIEELARLLANRIARMEVLKAEIKELQVLIARKGGGKR